MKIIAITQARLGSTRFPNKILQKVGQTTLIELHLQRILKSKCLDIIIVASTYEEGIKQLSTICNNMNVGFYQGDLNNVLDRFYQAAKTQNPDYVVRLTSDCPLIDATLIDDVIQYATNNDLDYCSNTLEEQYPDGQDVEVFKFSALEKAWQKASLLSEKEHVTPFIYKNSSFYGKEMFKAAAFTAKDNYNHVRLTVDEPIDLEVIKKLTNELGFDASWMEYTEAYLNTDIQNLNKNITRNEGYQKSLKND